MKLNFNNMRNKYLFNTGGGHSGLTAFQQNFLKVCIEDTEFFNENWENIYPNDWADVDVRALLSYAIQLKRNNIKVSYDNLLLYVEKTDMGFNNTIYKDTLEELRYNVVLEEDEIKDIKETYMYFGLYASMISQANMIIDWAKDGFKFGYQIKDMYEKYQIGMERNNAIYNRLLGVLGETSKNVDDNSWNT